MIAVLAFALGAAFGAVLAVHLLRASRRSDDELIQRFQQEMRALEGERKRLGRQLSQQLTALNDQTRSLSEALRRPGVRGRWGELTLRNVVEAVGMSEHSDFSPAGAPGGLGRRDQARLGRPPPRPRPAGGRREGAA
ncbi:MAG TPA: DNA recombination protein RmuC [Thermoleophilaceae bacterium]|nr:DNA recombination protein RmuC [Thermoleophilaceae bacterium]